MIRFVAKEKKEEYFSCLVYIRVSSQVLLKSTFVIICFPIIMLKNKTILVTGAGQGNQSYADLMQMPSTIGHQDLTLNCVIHRNWKRFGN